MKLTFFLPKTSSKCALPLFQSTVKAGFPSPAEDYIEQKLDLNKYLIKHPAATFYVRVEGSSMQNANINKDDLLIVDRSIEPKDHTIVIASINGEFTVKRIKMKNEELFLEAENPNFAPIKIDPAWDFQIWGTVIYIIHKAI